MRVFLAIAREGSMRAAGRALGLSQPTIARRLTAFEAGFGGQPCSTACPKGCASTLPVSNSSAAAEDAERAMLTLGAAARGGLAGASGTVRISTGECAAGFLARCLSGATTGAACPPASPWSSSSRCNRPTSRGARPISPCATSRPKAAIIMSPSWARSPVAVYRRRGADADAWVAYTPGASMARLGPTARACALGPAPGGRDRNSRSRYAPQRC